MSAIFLTAILVAAVCLSPVHTDNNPGTTPHVQEIFIGRCWDYKTFHGKTLPNVSADCNDLWNTFFDAFSYQPPCSLPNDAYDDYMTQAQQIVPANKAMFWSGTFYIAHALGGEKKRFVTLEDTLIGYLANSLVFCGQSSPPGMNYSRCPSWTDCPREVSELFWGKASTTFASSVSGEVTLVLDGSRTDKPAYSRDSFFAKFELPNLHHATKVTILVSHSFHLPRKETCDTGSILDLKKDITNRGLALECIDDPATIVHLLCVDDPTARECELVHSHMASKIPTNHQCLKYFNDRPDRFNHNERACRHGFSGFLIG